MTTYALRLENKKDSATRVRLLDTLGMMPAGPLRGRTGLRPDGGGAVTAVTGTMQVRVSPMLGWIDGPAFGQGGYAIVIDGEPSTGETITLDPGDATGSRVDTIAAQVMHNAFDASGNTLARVYAIKGNPATGVAPVVPAGHLALRDVEVPANRSAGNGGLSSSNLKADRRVYTSALGAITPVGSTAEANALPGKYRGLYVDNAETGALQRYDGESFSDVTPVRGTYNPVWTQQGGVGLAIGNGSLQGWWERTGKMVRGRVLLVRGTTTNQGSTNYLFSLPFPISSYQNVHGYGYVRNGSEYGTHVLSIGTSDVVLLLSSSTSRVNNSSVGTWQTGAAIAFEFSYEAA